MKGTWGSLYPVENIVRRWVEREETWDFPENAHFTQALVSPHSMNSQ